MRQVLSDVVVVELCQDSVAGSYCSKLFADFGADVVKVEQPGGDPLRRIGVSDPLSGVDGGLFLHLNTNKRGLRLDPDSHEDRECLRALLAASQVVIESDASGSLARWNINADSVDGPLVHLNVVTVTGFGVSGPYSTYKSADIITQAMAGVLLLRDRVDQMPVRYPGHAAQFLVGGFAAVGALAAVFNTRTNGRGAHVDCAGVEALASATIRAPSLLAHQYRGGGPNPSSGADGNMLIPMGVYPCTDGYVTIVTTIQQLQKMLTVLDDEGLRRVFADPDVLLRPETREEIDAVLYPWLLERTRAQATAAAQRNAFPLTPVLTLEEVLQADHLHQRGFWVHTDHPEGAIDFPGAPIRFTEGGWSLRRLPPTLGQHNDEMVSGIPVPARTLGSETTVERSAERLPLEGVRVVDMTAVFSGPAATVLLADLGAEVIRIENPWVFPPSTKGFQPRPTLPPELRGKLGSGYGPLAPGRPDRPYNRHSMNNVLSRNKLSCTMDIRRREGFELFLRLVDTADVLIENFKASSLTSMGIHPSELMARNPELIVVRMPPAGLSGEWANWAGFGLQFDGLAGILAIIGHRDATMMEAPTTFFMDSATGPAGAFAVLSALNYRAKSGRGQLVELAQIENIIGHLGDLYMDVQCFGRTMQRVGNRDPDRAPQGLYPCSDGRLLAISIGTDDEWHALAGTIGGDALLGDVRFLTAQLRQRNHDDLDNILCTWTSQQDVYQAFHRLQALGVPAGPFMDDTMFSTDPHIAARGWLKPLQATDVGTHLHPSHPYSGIPQAWRRGSPSLGEDNDYVYKEILGVRDEELERLREAQILGNDYLDPKGIPL